ncbi:MAG: hypothetical protein WC460_01305 [Patescibacteria group bacterium]
MIIKFSDKFESIFYAMLLANISGNFLVSKNDEMGLFANEEFIDIDQLNWLQILLEHDKKFGEIKWFNYNNFSFIKFKNEIDSALQKNKANKYKRVVFLIKQALKFGLNYNEYSPKEKVNKEKSKFSPIFVFDKRLI